MAALSRLGSALARLLPAARSKLLQARSQAESFEFADYVDLIHLLGLIREKVSNAAVRSATQAAISAAQASILASGTYGAAVRNATGLSVWFPPSQNLYHSYRSKYLALRFATSHRGWVDFLDAYYS